MEFRTMKFLKNWMLVCLMAWALSSTVQGAAAKPETLEFRNGDRVLFIGDSFFEREVDYGHIETQFTAHFADRDVIYRNLGWAADTPLGRSRASFDWNKSGDDWLKRVKDQVTLVKPTVAFLSYGMTASLEIASASSAGGQQALLDQFQREISQLMEAIREVSGAKVRFILLGPAPAGSFQGLLPEEAARLLSAQKAVDASLSSLATLSGARFQSMLGWSGQSGSSRDKHVSVDGVTLAESSYRVLAGMLDRELFGAGAPSGNRDLLNAAIRKKNELFFNRWRPANWTYLFGFRKHEQGRNSVEIPQFDPLIAQWDARIAKLRNLKKQDPATVAAVKEMLSAAAHPQHKDPNYKEQPIPTFDVAPGFEVKLWAENPLLYKPIQMNWDPQGRLWVASSRIYPQIRPGQDAEDAIIILEDTNGDGRADKHTVFAEGLMIPTGVVPDGKGGCYVAASHQLLHFADTDGDGRADKKTIVMSSFGTEDTHHNLHTLRWGYDGHLYLNQSIYTHTHIETPHGVRRLNSAGIWRFHPESWEMEVFTKGGCNPWGHHWDQFGNSFFTDGAGGKGVYHAMEGATYFTYSDMRREADSISPGNYPKFASLELVHSPRFPADWQGNAITCDFRAHRVVRFSMTDVGSSFQTREMPDLLRSTNVTFRPIDLRFGPDGALYIADWSNPIIQHGEVDFRDPRRDHEHGRIWRVTAISEGKVKTSRQDLTRLSTPTLLDMTLSKSGWEQEQSRLVLRQRGAEKVLPEVQRWLAKQTDPRAKLEAMWINEAFGNSSNSLVQELAVSQDERLRTAAARQLRH